MTSSNATRQHPPPTRTVTSNWTPRTGSNWRTGPHRSERGKCDRSGHRQGHSAGDGGKPCEGGRRRSLEARHADRPRHLDIEGGAVEQTCEPLADEHQQRQQRDCAERTEGDCLRADRLLHLLMDSRQLPDCQVDAVSHPRCQSGERRLEGGETGTTVRQAQADPGKLARVVMASERRSRGRRRQHGG